MNEKQQQLTFDKGISNNPSDILCDDNCLQESMNIVYRDGEHQPVQEPVKLCDDNGATQILRVHKVGNVENYIGLYNDGTVGYFQKHNDTTVFKQTLLRDVSQVGLMVEVVGKTIVIRTTDDLHYFIWSGTMYKDLGTSVPTPEYVDFQTYSGDNIIWNRDNVSWDFHYFPVVQYWNLSSSDWWDNMEAREMAGSAEARSKLFDRKLFNGPFFVRYAVEMYDGSYVHVSNPILMYPNFGDETWLASYGNSDGIQVFVHAHGSELQYKARYNFSEDWKDLVKGVVVFASLPEKTSNTALWIGRSNLQTAEIKWVTEGHIEEYVSWQNAYPPYRIHPLREEKDVIKGLSETDNFYKIAELGQESNVLEWKNISELMIARITDPDILVTQTKLPDSYMESSAKFPEHIFSYNGRLILANIQRSISIIDTQLIGYNKLESHNYEVYVTIQTDDGEKTAHTTITDTFQQFQYYFYYPDIRARKVRIYEVLNAETGWAKKIVDMPLKASSTLNGAFFMAQKLPPNQEELNIEEFLPTGYDETGELLSNQLFVSEVNNPWKYNASGNLTVGFGDIIGLSTQTTAISQGQFGQYPLLIFTTEGIYAASLNAEGVFTAVHPLSREVCNNPESITQTDGAVFFSSDKGLMVVVGNDVRCVSEQLSGEFPNLLKTAKIAYDYRDSLLWIASDINMDRIFGDKCWIYNIKTGAFHKSSYFIGGNYGSRTVRYFNGFFEEQATIRRVAPRYPEPIPAPEVKEGQYNKAALQAMVLESLITAIENDSVSVFRQYQQVDNSIIYDYTNGRFYRYVSIFFAYPDDSSHFVIRLYTKFENSENYLDAETNKPRTDVLYYNKNFRFRWNGSRNSFDKVREFDGILAESPIDVTTQPVDGGLIVGEEDGNCFESIVPSGASYNYGNKTVVYDTARERFLLKWTQYYTLSDSTPQNYTLYFTESVLLEDYVDNDNSYHPKTDKVYQDTTNDTNHPLYKWNGLSFEQLVDTDVTERYPMSGTMTITYSNDYIIQYTEQGVTDETKSLRQGPIVDCQEYDSGPYDEYAASRLQGHLKDVLIANLTAPGLDASPSGVMFYTDGDEFVEQRSYSYVYNGITYNGIMYYDTFQWGVGEAAKHLPSTDELYILNGTSYYAWDGNDLVQTFAGLANIVNSYPDTLFHKLGDGLYSLLNRPQPEDDENKYQGVIETRPMKLENALALKSIMQLRHVKSMDGTMTMQIFASNNMKEWVELHSLRGIPWLYYKFSFVFSNMSATDRFAGTMLITQERRLNKMR